MPFGPAGTPCGDVASVQGVSGGTPVPVSVSTLGQQTKAASVPVTVASDQGPLQITGSVYAIPTSSTDVGATPYRLIADGSTNATGVKASAGIALAITGDYPDADTTAVTAGDVIVNLAYK